MPLLLPLPAPGSQRRLLAPTARLASTLAPRLFHHPQGRLHPVSASTSTSTSTSSRPLPCSTHRPRHLPVRCTRQYAAQTLAHNHDNSASHPEQDHEQEQAPESVVEPRPTGYRNDPDYLDYLDGLAYDTHAVQPSRTRRKAMRQSQPARVLASLPDHAKHLYSLDLPGKTDVSYNSPRKRLPRGLLRLPVRSPLHPAPDHWTQSMLPVSLYTVLARCLQHPTTSEFECTKQELGLLHAKGFTAESPKTWAAALTNPDSIAAVNIFEPGTETPPFFLALLFLRRKHIRNFALGIMLRHIYSRLDADPIDWLTLKILVIRLLRHARIHWHELLPSIASLFTAQIARIYGDGDDVKYLSPHRLSDITSFCNKVLELLSIPASTHPILAARHQENAQFRILQFMANRTSPITVTRSGFRSVAKIQLAHPKTEKEREWAELKGPSWPPWKENRTAMDEDKGYEFGASRASNILHRMFEAGYAPRSWDNLAGIYAGWDTDLSPTIQTRTLLPRLARYRSKHNDSLLWAARIQTTRTRREAWACFLEYEKAGLRPYHEVYLAMFQKLHHDESVRLSDTDDHPDTEASHEARHLLEPPPTPLLPGDVKEVLPDPKSPLHLVYIGEPIPTYRQFYDRLLKNGLDPWYGLLAFFLETHPDFDAVIELLGKVNNRSNGAFDSLISGNYDASLIGKLPDYLFAAFINFLCRFGKFGEAPSEKPRILSPEEHAREFNNNPHYLLEYAYALLLKAAPLHLPTWNTFVKKLLYSQSKTDTNASPLYKSQVQYKIVVNIIGAMNKLDLDLDDELFRHVCTAVRNAAQAAYQGGSSIEETHDVLTTGSRNLRILFQNLVCANTNQPSTQLLELPPHAPGPTELHAYVRALGLLRDYEGLYSFSVWLTKHHEEVLARAHAQHGGSRMLFRTLVALRAGIGGWLETGHDVRPKAPEELRELVKAQINSVEALGGWPSQKYVMLYLKGHLRSSTPGVGGR